MTTLVAAKDLSIKSNLEIILKNINFSLSYKEKIGLIGYNGCGKSTLINNILNNKEITVSHECVIGHVSQSISTEDSKLSVLAYLSLSNSYVSSEWDYLKLLEKLEVKNVSMATLMKELSGGEQNKIKFARALLNSPNLLLLDEPTTNHLDIYGSTELITALNAYKGGFFLASHDRNLVSSTCNKAWVFDSNQIIEFLDIDKAYDHLEVGINQGASFKILTILYLRMLTSFLKN